MLTEGYGIYLPDAQAWIGRFGPVAWMCDALRFTSRANAEAELTQRGYANATEAKPRNAYVAYLPGIPRDGAPRERIDR